MGYEIGDAMLTLMSQEAYACTSGNMFAGTRDSRCVKKRPLPCLSWRRNVSRRELGSGLRSRTVKPDRLTREDELLGRWTGYKWESVSMTKKDIRGSRERETEEGEESRNRRAAHKISRHVPRVQGKGALIR